MATADVATAEVATADLAADEFFTRHEPPGWLCVHTFVVDFVPIVET